MDDGLFLYAKAHYKNIYKYLLVPIKKLQKANNNRFFFTISMIKAFACGLNQAEMT